MPASRRSGPTMLRPLCPRMGAARGTPVEEEREKEALRARPAGRRRTRRSDHAREHTPVRRRGCSLRILSLSLMRWLDGVSVRPAAGPTSVGRQRGRKGAFGRAGISRLVPAAFGRAGRNAAHVDRDSRVEVSSPRQRTQIGRTTCPFHSRPDLEPPGCLRLDGAELVTRANAPRRQSPGPGFCGKSITEFFSEPWVFATTTDTRRRL